MPATVSYNGMDLWVDVVDGVKGHCNIKTGWELHHKVVIDKINVGTASGRLIAAIAALSLLTPPRVIGSSHPDISTAILEDITPEAIGPRTVTLDLAYKEEYAQASSPNTGGTLEVGSSVIQEVTNVDHAGNALTLVYKGIPDHPQATVTRAQSTVRATRTETTNPLAKSRTYVGTMNQAGWLVDPGAASHTWLCTQYTGTTSNNGKSYLCQIGFQYKKGGWDQMLVAIDPRTGRVYQDVFRPDGTINPATGGAAIFQLLDDADFNALSLI